ncbi:Glutamyl-tRNA(Gln) amidotransferase subunit A, mitochondrial [Eumeta japonica]|uniref:Glutamyl-tRNA(Gln) amidotransferase subunit A, mitochondrial n=1 Tax=Eumeta variegata TaxID=151549 RepID=A0A4C1YJF6_EUMVA|nr:Glutamyl-tRNA(Gln) amidotransferase subunit A, mitochondrial [Eumeta japonica]
MGLLKSLGWESEHDWRISGGSSGGSAVSVTVGSSVAAIGSDTGGSTRILQLCVGCGNVDDATEILNAIAGPDDLDSTTIKKQFNKIKLNEDFSLKNVKVGIPKEYYCDGMSEEIVTTWKYIANLLESEGALVKSVSMPFTSMSIAVYSILNQCEVASNMARYDGLEYGLRTDENYSTEELYASSRSQGFNNVVRWRIFAGNYFLLSRNYDKYFMKALKLRRLIADDFKKVFNEDEIDVLLTPTTLSDAPKYKDFVSKHNRDQCAFQDYCTQPANMAGIPAISIPICLSKDNLPISLQLMAPSLAEEMLLNVAKKIESVIKFPRDMLIENE